MDKQLKVLILTNIPAPYRLPVFEALTQRVNLSVYFCQTPSSARQWQVNLHSKQVNYRQLTVKPAPLLGNRGIVYNPDLAQQLRQTSFDVYIAGENFLTFPAIVTVLQAARRRNKPFILWSEAIDSAYASGTRLSNCYRRWLYRRTDHFLAYGSEAQAYLKKRGAPTTRIQIGYQAIPASQLPPPASTKAALGLTGKTVVLNVGYFEKRKGLATLIHAFQEVATADCVLALVGSGPEENNLKAISRGDNRIVFPGYCDGADKSSWYATADIFVLPTQHDPWGLVVNEAMMFGLPVIVTNAAGCRRDLVQDNGRIIPTNNISALAATLSDLLHNPPLRQQMGKQSRQIIAKYTVQAAANAFWETINIAQHMKPR
ncbi:MAG: glycosyltransferase family 4 protein [Chloroflexi bacterium]|nr:glycosyltransferase family 4 protein [Chloroflexota bacterium]